MSFRFGVRNSTPLIRSCSSHIVNYARQQGISTPMPMPMPTINDKVRSNIFSSKRNYHKNDIVNKPSPSDEDQLSPSQSSSSLPLSSAVESKSGKTTFLNKSRNMSLQTSNNSQLSSLPSSSTSLLSSSSRTKPPQRQYSHTEIISSSLQQPAGPLYNKNHRGNKSNRSSDGEDKDDIPENATLIKPDHSDYHSDFFIPEVQLHPEDGRRRKRVLV